MFDPYFDKNILLVNFQDGLVDLSPAARPLTAASGCGAAYSHNGTSSLFCDGNADTIQASDNAAYDFLLADFTVEFFIRTASVGTLAAGHLFRLGSGTCGVYQGVDRGIYGWITNTTQKTGHITLVPDVWHHVALVRSSGTIELYVDGVASGAPRTYASNLTNVLTEFFPTSLGSLGSIRVIRGQAIYPSNFPVAQDDFPTSGPLFDASCFLVNPSSGWNDLSPAGRTVTTVCGLAHVKFGDGALAADYNNYATNAYTDDDTNYDFLLQDFTVEFWHKQSSTGYTGQVRLFQLYVDAIGITRFGDGTTKGYITGANYTGAFTVTKDVWHHYALVRASNVLELYVDGVPSGAPYTGTHNLTSAQMVFYPTDDGAVDSIRVTLGVARYTGPFTPPTQDFPTSPGGDTLVPGVNIPRVMVLT